MTKQRTITITLTFADDAKPEDMDALANLYAREAVQDGQDYLLDADGDPKWSRLSHMPVLATDLTATRTRSLSERIADTGKVPEYGIPA